MKRYGNLFDKAFSMGNLYQAYLDARRGKRTHHSCFEFERRVGTNLADIYNSLHYMLKIIKEAIANGKNIQIPKNYRRYYDALPA